MTNALDLYQFSKPQWVKRFSSNRLFEKSGVSIFRPELTQETHACFFSLLRDIICSTPDHRMSLTVLEDSVKAWTENPISPLNDWYHLATADISGSLSSALNFLSGDYTGEVTILNNL